MYPNKLKGYWSGGHYLWLAFYIAVQAFSLYLFLTTGDAPGFVDEVQSEKKLKVQESNYEFANVFEDIDSNTNPHNQLEILPNDILNQSEGI
mmetsp:Transcript_3084/g.5200  ORF Transcript_3084/g.5200 Transcript_3084/m.5200 type:complete len:92 (-) Transcript_3084:61-336(-)